MLLLLLLLLLLLDVGLLMMKVALGSPSPPHFCVAMKN
jgi:hypothetical protein